MLNTANTHIEKYDNEVANTLTTSNAGGDLYAHHGNLVIEITEIKRGE